MTVEEAAEIVLDNEPFLPCIQCEGTGEHFIGISQYRIRCTSCHGKKLQLKLDYEIACNVLGLETP